ncbi:MAG: 2-isopropylmalate synthase [Bacillota bacterium]|jgi:2-isopropylmalate synthase|nr:2-isopropylmalate synthase [Bacillota bacterium]NLP22391.1 2-isopropylmalate synthase [Erysipelotrichaceae bacterium]
MEKVKIFDTTLRDGEQTPRVSLNVSDKIQIAKQLERLGVDIIEAGFPISSDGDFEAVKAVSEAVENVTVCALARCNKKDIDRAAEALQNAKHPRIHVFIATSDIHLEYKLKMSKEQCVNKAVEMVKYAKSLVDDIQFSAEDASRSNPDFLVEIFEKVIEAGATTINVPDTVGYAQNEEYYNLIDYVIKNTKNSDKVTFSVHCHDDLGIATANALAGVKAGARQIECTINGIGERAGNSSLEEVAMILDTRANYYNVSTNIDTTQIYKTSKLISAITGVSIAKNKSVVGENCFLHESGIHQDGILKNRETYEIMNPDKIGIPKSDGLILGKHSGRHAFVAFLKHHGFEMSEEEINENFIKFKELTDSKKYVTIDDITSLVGRLPYNENYKFHSYTSSNNNDGTATVYLNISHGDNLITKRAVGNGQVDAAFKALNSIVKRDIEVLNFEINAVSSLSDALGEAKVKLKLDDQEISTSGLDLDIIKASILAYVQGINKFGI